MRLVISVIYFGVKCQIMLGELQNVSSLNHTYKEREVWCYRKILPLQILDLQSIIIIWNSNINFFTGTVREI